MNHSAIYCVTTNIAYNRLRHQF